MHLGTLTPHEQEQLRQRVLAGDKDARDQLAELMLRYLRRFRWLDEDAVQDLIIRIFEELDNQNPAKGALHAWCFARVKAATRYADLNAWKDSQRFPSYDGEPRQENYRLSDLIYEDRTIEQCEAHRIVHDALARLGPVPRAVLTLALEGYSVREIARAFRVSRSRAADLLAGAKQEIAKMILQPA